MNSWHKSYFIFHYFSLSDVYVCARVCVCMCSICATICMWGQRTNCTITSCLLPCLRDSVSYIHCLVYQVAGRWLTASWCICWLCLSSSSRGCTGIVNAFYTVFYVNSRHSNLSSELHREYFSWAISPASWNIFFLLLSAHFWVENLLEYYTLIFLS